MAVMSVEHMDSEHAMPARERAWTQTGCTPKIDRIRVVGIFRAAGGPGWPAHAEGACEFESRMRGCAKT